MQLRKKNYWLLISVTLVLFLLSSTVEAKKRRGKKRVPKKVTINFEDELLHGGPSGPGIFNLFQKKDVHYGRLIKFRKNFLPEMRRTAREIQSP